MYRDAKEELKRLEKALLEEDDGPDAWEIDMEEAISDILDLPPKDQKNKVIVGLVIAIILLTAAVAGLLVFLLAGGGFSL